MEMESFIFLFIIRTNRIAELWTKIFFVTAYLQEFERATVGTYLLPPLVETTDRGHYFGGDYQFSMKMTT